MTCLQSGSLNRALIVLLLENKVLSRKFNRNYSGIFKCPTMQSCDWLTRMASIINYTSRKGIIIDSVCLQSELYQQIVLWVQRFHGSTLKKVSLGLAIGKDLRAGSSSFAMSHQLAKITRTKAIESSTFYKDVKVVTRTRTFLWINQMNWIIWSSTKSTDTYRLWGSILNTGPDHKDHP